MARPKSVSFMKMARTPPKARNLLFGIVKQEPLRAAPTPSEPCLSRSYRDLIIKHLEMESDPRIIASTLEVFKICEEVGMAVDCISQTYLTLLNNMLEKPDYPLITSMVGIFKLCEDVRAT